METNSSKYGKSWSPEEHIIAFNLYCKLPFGKLHHTNPEIIELSKLLGRTPDSLAMKLCNFARLDPSLQERGIKGLRQGAKGEQEIWDKFAIDPESLAFESEKLMSELKNTPIVASEEILNLADFPEGLDKESVIKVRVNQRFFRDRILSIYGYTCCITGLAVPELLVASHIVPWAEDARNRLNPRNGLCLNALHDKIFDRGLMWIEKDYTIHFAHRLLKNPIEELADARWLVSFDKKPLKLPKGFSPDVGLLQRHADKVIKF
jgi:putative restriction endonuclease